ncbi:DUF1471 domain-containing protein [Salmonella enterica subsp. enterica serovar Mississippi]|nr:DUF1471 domain-containing protein [Salmonella enterica]EBT9749909.1 DUF1471 domain-containing protein [Salmonella enterica]EDS5869441.1 DUF1471 domain-containing protein [Salmonella enterica subsp. enterica serovar Mississippi]EJD3982614.1 DUF1471 domain-containing protein [Salmonella enterica]
MKYSFLALTAVISVFTTHATFSADEVTSGEGKVKIGVVSASNAGTLDELFSKLSEQADKKGATSFKVLSTTGNNKLHGVAEIYR